MRLRTRKRPGPNAGGNRAANSPTTNERTQVFTNPRTTMIGNRPDGTGKVLRKITKARQGRKGETPCRASVSTSRSPVPSEEEANHRTR